MKFIFSYLKNLGAKEKGVSRTCFKWMERNLCQSNSSPADLKLTENST